MGFYTLAISLYINTENMSILESIHREYETLEASVSDARNLLQQFPDDWTLKINIAQAEHRLEDLHNMMLSPVDES